MAPVTARLIVPAACAALSLALVARAQPPVAYSVILPSGTPGIGLPEGGLVGHAPRVFLNNFGVAAFVASWDREGTLTEPARFGHALYSWREQGGLTLNAYSINEFQGDPPAPLEDIGILLGISSGNDALFTGIRGNSEPVSPFALRLMEIVGGAIVDRYVTTDPVFGLPNTTLGGFVRAGAGPEVIVQGSLLGPGVIDANRDVIAIQSSSGGALSLLVREDDPCPIAGLRFGNFGFDPGQVGQEIASMDRLGQVAFISTLRGPGVTFQNGVANWIGTPGNIRLAARTQGPVPGMPGITFQPFGIGTPRTGVTGQLVFFAFLSGPGFTAANDSCVLLGTPEAGYTIIAREGAAIPGGGFAFSAFNGPLLINAAGHVAFGAQVLPTTPPFTAQYTLCTWSPMAGLQLVARQGGPLPPPLEGTFGFIDSAQLFFNAAGHVAFAAFDGAENVLIAGAPGDLRLIARGGQQLPGPGGPRTLRSGPEWITIGGVQTTGIGDIRLSSGNDDAFPSPMSDDGLIAFTANFTDNSSAVIAARFAAAPPDMTDTDGDGLLDRWERDGIDINGDGTIDLNLPALGADPMHKDLFVEMDVEEGVTVQEEVLALLRIAFRNAPLDNPDGTTGIRLHIQRDEVIPARVWNAPNATQFPPEYATVRNIYFGTFAENDSPNREHNLAAKRRAFRYCVVAEEVTPPLYSGLAEIDGDDMLLLLGNPALSIRHKAGIFMHELGHALGLNHGGAGTDLVQGKPNYLSVMNYALTVPYDWCRPFWRLDYSRGALATLAEGDLNETPGIFGGSSYEHYKMPVGFRPGPGLRGIHYVRLDGNPFDFGSPDGSQMLDGLFTAGVPQDLNYLATDLLFPGVSQPTPGQTLHGHHDWDAILLRLGEGGNYGPGVIGSGPEGEISPDIIAAIEALLPPAYCTVDFNFDDEANADDLSDFITCYFLEVTTPGDCDRADFNGDGNVNADDLSDFITSYFGGCP